MFLLRRYVVRRQDFKILSFKLGLLSGSSSQWLRPPEGKEKRGGGGEKRRDEEKRSKRAGGREVKRGGEGRNGRGHVTAIVSFPPLLIKPDALSSSERLGLESDTALILGARSPNGAVRIVLHLIGRAQIDRQSGHADSDSGKTMSGAPAPGTAVTRTDLFSKCNHSTKYKQHFNEHYHSGNN
ncbi:uncharacterized protein LOC100914995 [Sarcophilus harrisii]|uniref:uncharacterized protein LOC100914995 n=1 Tax=Sarcophilus harrisii TaxID=9305 RepID=UPI00062B8E0C|nr:uncharacterized protein LOC100914995 [Sarcophilus harrisii]